LGSSVFLLQGKWKTYVLYKTKDVCLSNQWLGHFFSQCGICFFIMKNFAAPHHTAIPHRGTMISPAKLTRSEASLRVSQSLVAAAGSGPSHMIRALSPPQDGQGADVFPRVTP
jgi:hypothetical protein